MPGVLADSVAGQKAALPALLGMIGGALLGYSLFQLMSSGWADFQQSVRYLFTFGWRSTQRGELGKNVSGTFRCILWLFLALTAVVGGGIAADLFADVLRGDFTSK